MELETCKEAHLVLTLHAAGAVTSRQFFHFGHRDTVVITFNRVLECGSSYSKLDGILGGLAL